jgi:Ca2+-binding RTX toxin-like protein
LHNTTCPEVDSNRERLTRLVLALSALGGEWASAGFLDAQPRISKMASIQGIYIALFGRPADPLGLAYFNEETDNGANLTAIGDLAASAEYQDRFEGQNNVQIVNSIYQSLFGRTADAAGLAYFVAELQSGRQNINTIAINILDGAQGDDLATVNNKITAANAFTAAIDTGDEIAGYNGNDAAEQGRLFLQGITADTATIPDAAATDAAVAAAVDAGGNTVAGTFTLTAGQDFADVAGSGRAGPPFIPTDFKFTSANEQVNGTNLTSQATDSLVDSSTTDNDRLTLVASAGAVLDAPTTVNIEQIDIDFSSYTGGAVNLSASGSKGLDLDGSLAAFTTVTGLVDSGITLVDASGLTSVLNGVEVSFAGQVGTVGVEIIGGGAGDILTGADGADKISGGAGNDVIDGGAGADILDGGDGDDQILGGTGNDTITGGAGADAINGGAGDDNIDGGAGNDLIIAGDGADTILGGAGNDTIHAGAGADSVRGGAGNDIIDLSAATSAGVAPIAIGVAPDGAVDTVILEATASDNGLDAINNFQNVATASGASPADVLNVSAFLGSAVSYVEIAAADALPAPGEFAAQDFNVIVLEDPADIANVNFAVNSKFVLVIDDGADSTVSYVTTNALGEIDSNTAVATLVGIGNALDLGAGNFA